MRSRIGGEFARRSTEVSVAGAGLAPDADGVLGILPSVPLIDLLHRPAHQRRLVAGGKPRRLPERPHALIVCQHAACPRPVRAPHATIHPEGVDDAQHRLPDIVVRECLPGQRAGTADLHPRVRIRRQRQQLRQIGPWFGERRRFVRLQQAEVVDDDDRVRVPPHQLRPMIQPAPAEEIHRQPRLPCRREAGVDARVGRVGGQFLPQHDPHAARAGDLCPVGDNLIDRGVGHVDRLHHAEPVGPALVDRQRVAGVEAVQIKRRNDHRRVHADFVHRGDHFLPVRGLRTMQLGRPGAAGVVVLVCVNLDVDGAHGGPPALPGCYPALAGWESGHRTARHRQPTNNVVAIPIEQYRIAVGPNPSRGISAPVSSSPTGRP